MSLLITLGSGVLGGSIGYLLGSQGDIIFNIDPQIVGVVLGAIIGSLVPRSPLGNLAHTAAAGLGVAVPTFVALISNRAASEVVWSMIAVAITCCGIINTLILWVERRR